LPYSVAQIKNGRALIGMVAAAFEFAIGGYTVKTESIRLSAFLLIWVNALQGSQ
jgi:hypothetical protein